MTKPFDAAQPAPVHDGFFMPAEWEPHRRTWMCWPARTECFGDEEALLRAKQAYARVARAISTFEPVVICAKPEREAEARLATGGKVEVIPMEIDDGWARDIGPTFLKSYAGRMSGVQWGFNAWGGKYSSYAADARFATRVLELLGAYVYEAGMICEGGAIHVDGQGTLIATEQCLLNPNRNPDLDKDDVERALALHLGVRRVIWLGSGFADAETDGHVDNIACFASPGRVLLGVPTSKDHPDYEPVREAARRLASTPDAEGRTLEVIELPQPKTLRYARSGALLPASYVNFYLANGAVIMPAFEDENDEGARAILADCFPGRDIMQIDVLDILEGGGGIHCITQQEPQA